VCVREREKECAHARKRKCASVCHFVVLVCDLVEGDLVEGHTSESAIPVCERQR